MNLFTCSKSTAPFFCSFLSNVGFYHLVHDRVRRGVGLFLIWRHKLICISLSLCKHACKSVCEVKSRIDLRPFSLGRVPNDADFLVCLETYEKPSFGKKQKQVQRFILAKKICWVKVHFKKVCLQSILEGTILIHLFEVIYIYHVSKLLLVVPYLHVFKGVKQWVDTIATWKPGFREYLQETTCASAAVARYNIHQLHMI